MQKDRIKKLKIMKESKIKKIIKKIIKRIKTNIANLYDQIKIKMIIT